MRAPILSSRRWIPAILAVASVAPAGPVDAREAEPFRAEARRNALGTLIEIASMPSVSNDREGVARAARWLADRFAAAGLRARILEAGEEGNPLVYAEHVPDGGAAWTVLFYMHYDTQPTGPGADWGSTGGKPFAPAIWSARFDEAGARTLSREEVLGDAWRAARVYARGAADDKAPIVMHLTALARGAARRDGRIGIKYLLDGEEEAGSPHIAATLDRHRELLEADLLVLCDGPMDAAGRPSVYLGTRGDMHMRLRVATAGSSAHSGNYSLLPNAAWRIASLLATMKDARGHVTVEGFLDDVVPPRPEERLALQEASTAAPRIAAHLGVEAFEGDPLIPYFERLLFRPSLIINHLAAGRPGNQIPHEAEALLEVRLVTAQSPDRIFEAFRRHVARHMPDASLEFLDGTPAARMDPRDPVVTRGIAAAREAAGGALIVYPTLGGTLPLLSTFEQAGYRYLGLPLVNFDNNQHVANENLRLAALEEGTLFLERFLAALDAGGGP